MFIPKVPNNSLSDELNEIVYIAKKTEHKMFFEFNQPATDDELLDLENYFNTTFPESYKDFMHFSNGANIADDYIIFFNISEVKALQIASFPDDYIIIGKIIGDGEVLCISKKDQQFIRMFEGEERHYINLKEFLKRPINKIRINAEEIVGTF